MKYMNKFLWNKQLRWIAIKAIRVPDFELFSIITIFFNRWWSMTYAECICVCSNRHHKIEQLLRQRWEWSSNAWSDECLWLWVWPFQVANIKGHITIKKPIYGFLSVSNTNYVSKVNGFTVIKRWEYVTLSLTFQGHPTSKVILPFERPYMISYDQWRIQEGEGGWGGFTPPPLFFCLGILSGKNFSHELLQISARNFIIDRKV